MENYSMRVCKSLKKNLASVFAVRMKKKKWNGIDQQIDKFHYFHKIYNVRIYFKCCDVAKIRRFEIVSTCIN